jgi:putative spermidine/putrescine transport system permease protein
MPRRVGLAVRVLASMGVALLVVPYVIVVVTSFDASSAAVFPPRQLSWRWYGNAFSRPAFREGLALSAALAAVSATASVAIGTAAAFVLVRVSFPGREVVNTMLAAPLMIPQIVTGLGFLILFTRLRVSSFVGIVLAHTVLAVPFVIRVVAARLQAFSASLEEAAMTLGASRLETLRRVTLPIIGETMAAAGVFAAAISFDNFYVSVFLTTTRGTLPVEIYGYARTEGDPTIAAISAILIVLSALGLAGLLRVFDLEALARATR